MAVGDDLHDPAAAPAPAVVPPLAAAAAAAAPAPAPEAPTVPMPAGGSTGRGSRVYDRDARAYDRGVVRDPARLDKSPEKAAAPGDGPPRAATGRAARPAAGAPRLFDEDELDWAKLVDGALPELAAADPDARRIVVRLPASAALQGASDTGRVEALAAMGELPDLARDLLRQDARASGRSASSDQETQTFRLGALAAEPAVEAAPAPRRGASSRRAARQPEPAPPATPAAPLDPTPGHVVSELRADRMDPALVVARAPDGRRAAAFDRLAARLLEALVDAAPDGAGRAVLVTSAGPGEGRTGAAANLAMAVARRRGRGAVLVDADPRGRGLPAALGLGPSAGGLHEALRAQADPAPWLHHLPLGRLDLLPLGTPGQDSAALLAGDGMRQAVEHLRPRATRGLVVVDGPAALGPGGLCGLEAHVDAVLLVVRAGATSRAAVRDAAAACGRRLLGVVLLEP